MIKIELNIRIESILNYDKCNMFNLKHCQNNEIKWNKFNGTI